MIPLVIICGKSKSGKDTLGKHLCEKYGGVSIALADPLKAILKKHFFFTQEQLWGDSDSRNIEIELPKVTFRGDSWIGSIRFCDEILEIQENSNKTGFNEGRLEELLKEWMDSFKNSPTTIRKVLQTFGTEVMRKYDPYFWVDLAKNNAKKLLDGGYTWDKYNGCVKESKDSHRFVLITDGRFRNEILAVKYMGGMAVKVERPNNDSLTPVAGVPKHSSEMDLDGIPDHFFDVKILNNLNERLFLDKAKKLATRYLHLDLPGTTI